MSKSYKKYPLTHIEKKAKIDSKKLRRNKLDDISNGMAYKRYSGSCCNWSSRWTKEDAIKEYREKQMKELEYKTFFLKFPTLDDYLLYWRKCSVRK